MPYRRIPYADFRPHQFQEGLIRQCVRWFIWTLLVLGGAYELTSAVLDPPEYEFYPIGR